ncbi:MAG: hypothetical protein JO356_18195, partial [Acidobacteria bacterium]|nr:hypothetical protein [Acidobacteriota bacterium]
MASRSFIAFLAQVFLFLSISIHAAGQQWLRVSSAHFSVLTDSGRAKGHDLVARFEQMRAVFAQLLVRNKVRMAQPLEIIAVSTPAAYALLTPQNSPPDVPGLFLIGEERVYIVLNAADPDCWRAVEHSFALYLLNYNYPPTPKWFDQGFAEYFASLRFTPTEAELGGEPEFSTSSQTFDSGQRLEMATRRSVLQVLASSAWLPLAQILGVKPGSGEGRKQYYPRFDAQSWLLVHYLMHHDKLSQAGAYFELVENQKVSPSEAVQRAFGMSLEQLEQALKDEFHSFESAAAVRAGIQARGGNPSSLDQMPLSLSANDVAESVKEVPAWEAQALVDEVEVRISERREAAMDQLRKLAAEPRTETVATHRALAWGYLEKADLSNAFQELNAAVQMNSSDTWARMDLALASYHSGQKGARVQGLANMMESLHIVISQYPEYADAYNLLAWARLTGGGANAAVDAIRQAVQLSPRREDYKLRWAAADMAAKKWDDAVGLLENLKSSPNPEISSAANKDLHDIPYLRKFGLPP